jgi:hypothetical protein
VSLYDAEEEDDDKQRLLRFTVIPSVFKAYLTRSRADQTKKKVKYTRKVSTILKRCK